MKLELTLGIAYTKDPNGVDDAESGVAEVRNSSKFGPLLVSWRWIFVCGPLGSGKDTSMGACDASPFVNVVAIAWGVWMMVTEQRGAFSRPC
jgi:hypothetical protein